VIMLDGQEINLPKRAKRSRGQMEAEEALLDGIDNVSFMFLLRTPVDLQLFALD
jgi:hypothetical protein